MKVEIPHSLTRQTVKKSCYGLFCNGFTSSSRYPQAPACSGWTLCGLRIPCQPYLLPCPPLMPWCKGKSQEERPVHLGKVGKGGDSVQVCAQGRSHRHRAVFLSSLPSFLPFFLPSLFGCIGSSLQHRGTWLHHTESFVLALGLSSLVHKLNCSKACRILVPGPGIKPASPALRGRFLTTGLPGKSQDRAFKREHQCPCPFSQLTGHCILLHWSSAANNI